MTSGALGTYLNDHLGGATVGAELAARIAERATGELGTVLASVAREIDEDRETLVALMEHLDIDRNPIKEATAWMAEKAGQLKLSGLTSGDRDLGLYTALEALTLGVTGKLALWNALRAIAPARSELDAGQLSGLADRARRQHDTLEAQRLALASRVLT